MSTSAKTQHPLLARQLRRLGLAGDEPPSPERWHALLDTVTRTYDEADQDRYTMERSLAISSRELRQLYDDLKRASDTQLAEERDKLAKSLAIHQATLEASSDGVIIVNEQREVVGHNRRFAEIWGVPGPMLATRDADALLAMGLAKVADPEAFAARVRHLNESQEASDSEVVELVDGRVLERDSAPVVSPSGLFYGRVWFYRDITERREAEARVRAMQETAERASRAKSDFLLNMSHEMRTPLNAILGFARVLRRSAGTVLGDEQKAHLQDIVEAGGYLLQLVNDLLDLRSLEESSLELVPVALEPLIVQGIGLVRPLVSDKRLELSYALPADLPDVLADRRAVVQILANLLSNAAKFTPQGGTISVSARASGPWIEIAVKDTGAGISPADQERLFVYFEQLGGKHAAHMKGSGVGLALTRALAEKQGGAITVESSVGQGSTFRVRLGAASPAVAR
jgi:PAS domain S-box-containing protein